MMLRRSRRSMNGVEFSIVPKRIRIERFKSIDSITLDLRPGVNVLVGPNASGKSNVLEALTFLRKALIDEASRTPYHPVREYWSPDDIFYMRDTGKPIIIGVEGELTYKNTPKAGTEAKLDVGLTVYFDSLRQTVMPVKIEARLSSATTIIVEPGLAEIVISKDSFKYPIVRKHLDSLSKKSVSLGDKHLIIKVALDLQPPILLENLISFLKTNILSFLYMNECKQYYNKYLACIYEPIRFPDILEKEKKYKIIIPIVAKISRQKSTQKRKKSIEPEGLLHPVTIIRLLKDEFLGKVIMLKHPDTGRVREPTPLSVVGEPLNERATNLPAVLFALREEQGSVPSIVEDAVRRFFPETTLSLRTQYGRVAMIAYEGGIELTPRNMSDGLIKLVALMTAASLNPALLLIDEIENSMHYEMQEYVIRELNSLGIPTIVATHSPYVVDLVGPEGTIILSKEPGGATRAERVRDAERLKKRLTELGISFSDYVFYERTRVRRG